MQTAKKLTIAVPVNLFKRVTALGPAEDVALLGLQAAVQLRLKPEDKGVRSMLTERRIQAPWEFALDRAMRFWLSESQIKAHYSLTGLMLAPLGKNPDAWCAQIELRVMGNPEKPNDALGGTVVLAGHSAVSVHIDGSPMWTREMGPNGPQRNEASLRAISEAVRTLNSGFLPEPEPATEASGIH